MPLYTHVSGSTSTGRAANGVSKAEADEPKPGMPEATKGFQWNAAGRDFNSDIRVKYDVGGSLITEFCTSSGRVMAQGSKFEKTSFGDTTRPMKSVGKKKT